MNEQMTRLYQAAREIKGIKGQSALARALGTSPQTLHNWELRGISKAGLLTAQKVIGCSASWIESGQGIMLIGPNSNVVNTPLGARQIPLIGHDQAIAWVQSPDPYALPPQGDWLMTDESLSPRAFGLAVHGDAMLPKFQPGDRVIIDPEVTPQPGDFVVAHLDADGVIFRKYRTSGLNTQGTMIFELVPINPDYSTTRSDTSQITIIGTMIEHRTYRRRT